MSKFKYISIIMIMFFITILSSCQGFDNFKKTTFEKEIDVINENLINKYNVKLLDTKVNSEDEIAKEGWFIGNPNSSPVIGAHELLGTYNHDKRDSAHYGGTMSIYIDYRDFKRYGDQRVRFILLYSDASFYGYNVGEGDTIGGDAFELYDKHLSDRYSFELDSNNKEYVCTYSNIVITVDYNELNQIDEISFSVRGVEDFVKSHITPLNEMDINSIKDMCFDRIDNNYCAVAIFPAYIENDEIIIENGFYFALLDKKERLTKLKIAKKSKIYFSDSTIITSYHPLDSLYYDKELTLEYNYDTSIDNDIILYAKYEIEQNL